MEIVDNLTVGRPFILRSQPFAKLLGLFTNRATKLPISRLGIHIFDFDRLHRALKAAPFNHITRGARKRFFFRLVEENE